MLDKARRLTRHRLSRLARRALRPLRKLIGGLTALTCTAPAAWADETACAADPAPPFAEVCYLNVPGAATYGHEVLGDTPEWDTLRITWAEGHRPQDQPFDTVNLAKHRHVFEDIAPRLIDMDGDGLVEVVGVESSFAEGARLFVLRGTGSDIEAARTPYIGQRNRWLAPIGAADLDGDGAIEVAYIDRPHLAKTLRVWRYLDGALTEVASLEGLTNHKIGEPFISGGIRDCGDGPEIVTADSRWQSVVATRLVDGKLEASQIADFDGSDSFRPVLACEN